MRVALVAVLLILLAPAISLGTSELELQVENLPRIMEILEEIQEHLFVGTADRTTPLGHQKVILLGELHLTQTEKGIELARELIDLIAYRAIEMTSRPDRWLISWPTDDPIQLARRSKTFQSASDPNQQLPAHNFYVDNNLFSLASTVLRMVTVAFPPLMTVNLSWQSLLALLNEGQLFYSEAHQHHWVAYFVASLLTIGEYKFSQHYWKNGNRNSLYAKMSFHYLYVTLRDKSMVKEALQILDEPNVSVLVMPVGALHVPGMLKEFSEAGFATRHLQIPPHCAAIFADAL